MYKKSDMRQFYQTKNGLLTEIGLRYNLCFPEDGNDMAITLSVQ